jgi:hypothetical protein
MFILRAVRTSDLMDRGTGCREYWDITDDAPGRWKKYHNVGLRKLYSSHILLG